MAVSIKIDQAAHPPGVAGKAREDISTGTAVTLTAVGGPYAAYSWSVIHKPSDIYTNTPSAAALTAPAAAVTNLTPIDQECTYLVQVLVDSGSGLGATASDVARITFYAGAALNPDPERLPRRTIAFGETTEHNVNDAIQPAGNTEGWAREWQRWFALIQANYDSRVLAAGRVTLTGGGAVLVRGNKVAGVVRTGVGTVEVTLSITMPDTDYAPWANALGAPGGSCTVDTLTPTTFVVTRADFAGVVTDADFTFGVGLGD